MAVGMTGRQAVVEVRCGRCGVWWMRWTVSLDKPFAEDEVTPWTNGTVFEVQAPGGMVQGTDGAWHRWAPGPAADLPAGETWARYVFKCPSGCRSNPVARVDKLEETAVRVLRGLHSEDTDVVLTMTVDKLLRFAA